jgi:LPS export ABC transporter protein LptC
MFTRSPYWLPLGLLASVALLSFWLEQAAKSSPADGKKGLGEPDAIVENFHSTLNNKNGQPLYNLDAKRLRYYGKSNQTQVDNPVLQHLSETDGSVRITSRQANIAPDGDAILFAGQARLIQIPANSNQGMTLQSEQIEAYPRQHLIKIPATVNVNGTGLQLTAGNLELDTEKRILKLRGRVKVQYKT